MEVTVTRDEDIFLRFFAVLQQHGHQVPSDTQAAAEVQLRQELGGNRVYIPRAPSRVKKQRLASALRSGANIREAMERARVGRSWGFELLGQKSRFVR
jgi:hypothetical protein